MQFLVDLLVVSHHHAAVPRREVLSLVVAEDADVTVGARVLPLPHRAHVVRAVFDHEDAVLIADLPYRVEFGAEAPEVCDDEGLRLLGDVCPHRVGIHQVGIILHIDEAWDCVE